MTSVIMNDRITFEAKKPNIGQIDNKETIRLVSPF